MPVSRDGPLMARIRTIKPEFWQHEVLSEQPEATHMLAAALLNYADDHGYFNAHPALIKAACFPLRDLTTSVPDSLKRLESIGYLHFATGSDGKRYGWIATFDDHQVVNRAKDSKIKKLLGENDPSGIYHVQITDQCMEEGKGREQGTGNGMEVTPTALSSSDDVQPDLLGNKTEPKKIPDAQKQRRLAEVAKDAMETFNASTLTKKNGGELSAVQINVGTDKRRAQVKRCIKVARDICRERLDSETITRDFWVSYWKAVGRDDFYSGRKPGGKGHENYKPDFDLLTREATMVKLFDMTVADDE